MDCRNLQLYLDEEQKRLEQLKIMVQNCSVSNPQSSASSLPIYEPILHGPPNANNVRVPRIEMFTLPKQPFPGQYIRIQRIKPLPTRVSVLIGRERERDKTKVNGETKTRFQR